MSSAWSVQFEPDQVGRVRGFRLPADQDSPRNYYVSLTLDGDYSGKSIVIAASDPAKTHRLLAAIGQALDGIDPATGDLDDITIPWPLGQPEGGDAP